MRIFYQGIYLGLCGFLLNCSSTHSRKAEFSNSKSLSSAETSNNPLVVEIPKSKTRKRVEVPNIENLKKFISYYRKTLESLGQKKEDSSYVVETEEVEVMRKQLARILQIELSGLTFLVNPRIQGSWFGNCTLVLDKQQEKLVIISKLGEEQILSLKDKVFGGLYKSEQGEWVFVSTFYGDLQKKVPYRVFWGATELKVISLSMDRTKEGTIEGQAKSPTGTLLTIFRKGRDNKAVQINGQVLSPVFE